MVSAVFVLEAVLLCGCAAALGATNAQQMWWNRFNPTVPLLRRWIWRVSSGVSVVLFVGCIDSQNGFALFPDQRLPFVTALVSCLSVNALGSLFVSESVKALYLTHHTPAQRSAPTWIQRVILAVAATIYAVLLVGVAYGAVTQRLLGTLLITFPGFVMLLVQFAAYVLVYKRFSTTLLRHVQRLEARSQRLRQQSAGGDSGRGVAAPPNPTAAGHALTLPVGTGPSGSAVLSPDAATRYVHPPVLLPVPLPSLHGGAPHTTAALGVVAATTAGSSGNSTSGAVDPTAHPALDGAWVRATLSRLFWFTVCGFGGSTVAVLTYANALRMALDEPDRKMELTRPQPVSWDGVSTALQAMACFALFVVTFYAYDGRPPPKYRAPTSHGYTPRRAAGRAPFPGDAQAGADFDGADANADAPPPRRRVMAYDQMEMERPASARRAHGLGVAAVARARPGSIHIGGGGGGGGGGGIGGATVPSAERIDVVGSGGDAGGFSAGIGFSGGAGYHSDAPVLMPVYARGSSLMDAHVVAVDGTAGSPDGVRASVYNTLLLPRGSPPGAGASVAADVNVPPSDGASPWLDGAGNTYGHGNGNSNGNGTTASTPGFATALSSPMPFTAPNPSPAPVFSEPHTPLPAPALDGAEPVGAPAPVPFSAALVGPKMPLSPFRATVLKAGISPLTIAVPLSAAAAAAASSSSSAAPLPHVRLPPATGALPPLPPLRIAVISVDAGAGAGAGAGARAGAGATAQLPLRPNAAATAAIGLPATAPAAVRSIDVGGGVGFGVGSGIAVALSGANQTAPKQQKEEKEK